MFLLLHVSGEVFTRPLLVKTSVNEVVIFFPRAFFFFFPFTPLISSEKWFQSVLHRKPEKEERRVNNTPIRPLCRLTIYVATFCVCFPTVSRHIMWPYLPTYIQGGFSCPCKNTPSPPHPLTEDMKTKTKSKPKKALPLPIPPSRR